MVRMAWTMSPTTFPVEPSSTVWALIWPVTDPRTWTALAWTDPLTVAFSLTVSDLLRGGACTLWGVFFLDVAKPRPGCQAPHALDGASADPRFYVQRFHTVFRWAAF